MQPLAFLLPSSTFNSGITPLRLEIEVPTTPQRHHGQNLEILALYNIFRSIDILVHKFLKNTRGYLWTRSNRWKTSEANIKLLLQHHLKFLEDTQTKCHKKYQQYKNKRDVFSFKSSISQTLEDEEIVLVVCRDEMTMAGKEDEEKWGAENNDEIF